MPQVTPLLPLVTLLLPQVTPLFPLVTLLFPLVTPLLPLVTLLFPLVTRHFSGCRRFRCGNSGTSLPSAPTAPHSSCPNSVWACNCRRNSVSRPAEVPTRHRNGFEWSEKPVGDQPAGRARRRSAISPGKRAPKRSLGARSEGGTRPPGAFGAPESTFNVSNRIGASSLQSSRPYLAHRADATGPSELARLSG